jgi:hypothetical protein
VSGSAHQHLLVQMGKEGTIYLIDRDNTGKFCSNCTSQDTQIVQPRSSTGGPATRRSPPIPRSGGKPECCPAR